MKEQIMRIKEYVEENKEDIVDSSIGVGALLIAFALGRLTGKQNYEYRATYTDKSGNLISEVYKKANK